MRVSAILFALSGRPRLKGDFISSKLEELLSVTPQEYGYQEAGWQINILRDWFSRQGCDACENTIVKALKQLGYVYKRFSKAIPKNVSTPEEKRDMIEKMINTINSQPINDIEILFEDESHFSNQPFVGRGWFKQGEKKSLTQKKTD